MILDKFPALQRAGIFLPLIAVNRAIFGGVSSAAARLQLPGVHVYGFGPALADAGDRGDGGDPRK